jgi:hypothetical protein
MALIRRQDMSSFQLTAALCSHAYEHPALEGEQMAVNAWAEHDTEKAQQFWVEYQRQHDISERLGQTAGIDPSSGRIWFEASAKDIVVQMEAEGMMIPLYFVRVGTDHYLRKGRSR